MNKNNGNSNIPKEVAEGLKGFEDVFEDYINSEDYKETEKKEREKNKLGEQYELQRFLEQENDRLSAIENFYTKKIPLKINFSQTDKLIQTQLDRKKILQDKIIDESLKLDSTFQKNLAQLLNSHFA